jgi:uncharacterized membrane protein YsdA (DUF1294 family)
MDARAVGIILIHRLRTKTRRARFTVHYRGSCIDYTLIIYIIYIVYIGHSNISIVVIRVDRRRLNRHHYRCPFSIVPDGS